MNSEGSAQNEQNGVESLTKTLLRSIAFATSPLPQALADRKPAPRPAYQSSLVISFVILVAIPAIFSTGYFTFIQSKVYATEARILISTAADVSTSDGTNLTALLDNISSGSSSLSHSQDALASKAFILSRNAIQTVGGADFLSEIYGSPEIDVFSRLKSPENTDQAWKYWQSKVSVYVNNSSGILTLRVKAFSPEESYSLAHNLIAAIENFANSIVMVQAEEAKIESLVQLERTLHNLDVAKKRLLQFQKKNELIDPVDTSQSILTSILSLRLQRIELENEQNFKSIRGFTNDTSIERIVKQIEIVDQQIIKLQEELTGLHNQNSFANLLQEYEQLQLELVFQQELYTQNKTTYERAAQQLRQKQKYVLEIVEPVMPTDPVLPRPALDAILTFIVLLILWSTLSLIYSAVKDNA